MVHWLSAKPRLSSPIVNIAKTTYKSLQQQCLITKAHRFEFRVVFAFLLGLPGRPLVVRFLLLDS
jgi:hypothetical protein